MHTRTRLTLVVGLVALFGAGLWFGLQWYQQQADALNLSRRPNEEKPTHPVKSPELDTGYVLVKTTDTTKLKTLEKDEQLEEDAAASASLSKLGIKRYAIKSDATAEEVADRALAKLKTSDPEAFAEPDALFAPELTPDDPWYSAEWYLRKVFAPEAWDITQGSSSVIIAVLDSGVEATHEDLSAKIVPGWNTYENNANTDDVYGHGTSVAGVAGASTNNAKGVASICWNCKIMPMRVTGTNGYASASALATALSWAADHGARVANMSFEVSQSSTVRAAAQSFTARGGIVTASAGNQGEVHTGADNPYILTVSATDGSDNLYSWSDRGSDIDVAAPGSVHTTGRGNTYGGGAGTSYSAPTVASLAGLILSHNSSLTSEQVQGIIKQSADDLGSAGWDSVYGWGRVNAFRAVQQTGGGSSTSSTSSTGSTGDTTAPSAPTSLTATALNNSSVELTWKESTDNVAVTQYHIYRNNSLLRSVPATDLSFVNTGLTAGATYSYFVKAADAAGNVSAASNTATVTLPQGFTWTVTPYISSKTSTSAVVSFTTSQASTAVVEFWPRNGAHQTVSSASATSHNVSLTGLTPGGKYQYFVKVTAADGTVLTSPISSFNTPRR